MSAGKPTFIFIAPQNLPFFDSRTSYTPRSVFQDGSERWSTFTLTSYKYDGTLTKTNLTASKTPTSWATLYRSECSVNAVNATIGNVHSSYTQSACTTSLVTGLRQLSPVPLQRFHVLLNSLFKVLCNFPSRYLFAIGFISIFSLRWSLSPALGCTFKQPDSKV